MQESPKYNRISPSALRGGLVNWTFTYRKGSTMPGHYNPEFLPISANIDPRHHFRDDPYFMRTPPPGASYSTINYAEGKSKKVAWFVSNCHTPNGRGKYMSALRRFVGFQLNLEYFELFRFLTHFKRNVSNVTSSEIFILCNASPWVWNSNCIFFLTQAVMPTFLIDQWAA